MSKHFGWVLLACLIAGLAIRALSLRYNAALPDFADRSIWAKGFKPGATHISGWGDVWIESLDPLVIETAYQHGFRPGDVIGISGIAGPNIITGVRMVKRVLGPYQFSIVEPSGMEIPVKLRCADCHASPDFTAPYKVKDVGPDIGAMWASHYHLVPRDMPLDRVVGWMDNDWPAGLSH